MCHILYGLFCRLPVFDQKACKIIVFTHEAFPQMRVDVHHPDVILHVEVRQRINPVSYTHLDVYKRQSQSSGNR